PARLGHRVPQPPGDRFPGRDPVPAPRLGGPRPRGKSHSCPEHIRPVMCCRGVRAEEARVRFFLDNGLTLLGQRTSFAELIGQICALAVVFLAKIRTLWTWPVQVAATVMLFSVYVSANLGGLAAR